MTELFAQPYNIDARGFYFNSIDSYAQQVRNVHDGFGLAVEEFEIQFMHGEEIDAALFDAWGVHQGNIGSYFEAVEMWSEDEKIRAIIAIGKYGYRIDPSASPDNFEIDFYEMSLKELAEHFVEEGLFGEIPKRLQYYLDMDAIARDLGMEYCETSVAGRRIVYR